MVLAATLFKSMPLSHLLEPGFTTKPVEKHRWIIWTCSSVVQQMCPPPHRHP